MEVCSPQGYYVTVPSHNLISLNLTSLCHSRMIEPITPLKPAGAAVPCWSPAVLVKWTSDEARILSHFCWCSKYNRLSICLKDLPKPAQDSPKVLATYAPPSPTQCWTSKMRPHLRSSWLIIYPSTHRLSSNSLYFSSYLFSIVRLGF